MENRLADAIPIQSADLDRPGQRRVRCGGHWRLAFLKLLDFDYAMAGATLVLAAGALIGWGGASSIAIHDDQAAPDREGELSRDPPWAALVDALPDPVLLVTAIEPDDPTGRRYVLANKAAREVLNLSSGAGLLVTAIRDPEVLEAVDEALFGQVPATALYDQGGSPGQGSQGLRPTARR